MERILARIDFVDAAVYEYFVADYDSRLRRIGRGREENGEGGNILKYTVKWKK